MLFFLFFCCFILSVYYLFVFVRVYSFLLCVVKIRMLVETCAEMGVSMMRGLSAVCIVGMICVNIE